MTTRQATALEHEIAQLVIDTLNLEDITAAGIPPEQPLFGEGLGLDSVDALELALALQKTYGIRVESDAADARNHFASVASLAAFVESRPGICAG
jgi:acyl carrier protein